MTYRLAFLAAAAAGCIGIKTNPDHDKVDAAPPRPDAPPDAAPDAPPDAPDVLFSHHYIIDKQLIPANNAEAREYALDLNGDTTLDNQLGMVASVFAGQGLPSQPQSDRSVDRGASLMLIDFLSNGFNSGTAKLTLYTGVNPQPPACNGGSDTTCRRHLDGNGSFTVAVTSARDELLVGRFSSGTVTTDAGGTNRLHLSVTLLTSNPVTLELIGARARVSGVNVAGIATGVIAGAIAQTEIDAKLLPAWATGMNTQIVQDCGGAPPSCGCGPGSTGKTFVELFDAVHDCTISVGELASNSLMQALITPDLMLDGKPALSIGIGFRAVRATFTP